MARRTYQKSNGTTDPIHPADARASEPEFLRTPDVQRIFGIRRGTLYNLEADGRIRGVLLRCRGSKSGIKLWPADAIRALIASAADVSEVRGGAR
jgi:hypothetical protein